MKRYRDGKYIINEKEFTEDELSNNFIVAYCITTCKYQGDQIDTHYNIFDIDKMNANELYVALSRTTKKEYIHLCSNEIKQHYDFFDYEKEKNIIYQPVIGGKYKNSKIYVITTSDNKYYVGSTTKKQINDRLQEHLKDNTSPLYNMKNCKIELITNCNCFNREELENIEKNYIEKYCKDKGIENILNKNMKLKEEVIEPKLIIEKTIRNKYNIIDMTEQGYFRIQMDREWKKARNKKKI